MKNEKVGTVALVVGIKDNSPALVETFSDDHEIAVFEAALNSGEVDPIGMVHAMRAKQKQEDEDFGDYVEELLSQPFVRPEIQEHGVHWLKSKMRIEEYQRCEQEATKVIAGYAFKLFQENPDRSDFLLAGPAARVRIRVFTLSPAHSKSGPSASEAA